MVVILGLYGSDNGLQVPSAIEFHSLTVTTVYVLIPPVGGCTFPSIFYYEHTQVPLQGLHCFDKDWMAVTRAAWL